LVEISFHLTQRVVLVVLVLVPYMYDRSMSQSKPSVYTIGIAGGSGAGKSTLASKLFEALGGSQNVTYIVHDSYYRDQSHKTMEERTQTNFDHPDALETELMVKHIRELKAGNIVQVPAYDFTTHTRIPQAKAVVLAGPRPVLLIEGILILCHPELVQEMDLKVFVVSFILYRFDQFLSPYVPY
jgi:uridine kinase